MELTPEQLAMIEALKAALKADLEAFKAEIKAEMAAPAPTPAPEAAPAPEPAPAPDAPADAQAPQEQAPAAAPVPTIDPAELEALRAEKEALAAKLKEMTTAQVRAALESAGAIAPDDVLALSPDILAAEGADALNAAIEAAKAARPYLFRDAPVPSSAPAQTVKSDAPGAAREEAIRILRLQGAL